MEKKTRRMIFLVQRRNGSSVEPSRSGQLLIKLIEQLNSLSNYLVPEFSASVISVKKLSFDSDISDRLLWADTTDCNI